MCREAPYEPKASRQIRTVLAASATHPMYARQLNRFGQPMRTSGPPLPSARRGARSVAAMNQTSPAHGTTDATARIGPITGSPATANPAIVAASGKPRMKIDPSAAWTLLRVVN
jgi:hypothetical protein